MRDRRRKNPLKWIIVLLILVGAAFFGVRAYYNFLLSPIDPNGKMVAFVVQKGETTSSVAERLEKEGLIRSAFVFKIEVKSLENDKIEAGDFKLSSAMSVSEIIDNLSKGAVDKWVTLLEGWRVEEMAEEINSKLKIQKSKFLEVAKNKEGYLFPDTYLFNPEASAETVVSALENNFESKYTDDIKRKIHAKGLTEGEGVILASLVEREARSDEVRTKVAGIILKRLNMGMKLDIDATVRYAKDSQTLRQKGKVDKYWQGISRDDYSGVISPYNTYLNNGLPPGPICNPSLSSLKAVANADPSTPYLYYYHDSAGNSYYARTLEEHNRNVAEHR